MLAPRFPLDGEGWGSELAKKSNALPLMKGRVIKSLSIHCIWEVIRWEIKVHVVQRVIKAN